MYSLRTMACFKRVDVQRIDLARECMKEDGLGWGVQGSEIRRLKGGDELTQSKIY